MNDPVADKLMERYASMPALDPPEDNSITTLYVGNLGDNVTEKDLKYVICCVTGNGTAQKTFIEGLWVVLQNNIALKDYTATTTYCHVVGCQINFVQFVGVILNLTG